MSFEPSASALSFLVSSSGVAGAYWDACQGLWRLTPGLAGGLGLPACWTNWDWSNWHQRIHPDDLLAFTAAISSCSDDAKPGEGELRLRHENGGWRWFRYRESRDSDHRFLHLADDTEARQERAALVDSQLRLRTIYDLAPVAIIIWSREGRITDWNHMAEHVFGYARDEVIGEKLAPLLIAPAAYDVFAASIAASVKGNAESPLICSSRVRSGQEILCDWRTVALRGPKGILQGLLSLALDVTAVVTAEGALRRSRDQAEALSRAKSEFLAVISHELRTPLNGVLGMAQLLELDVSEPHLQQVKAIRTSGEGLLAIINGIVDYTEIDTRSAEASIEEISPAESVALIAERYGLVAKHKGLAFQLELDEQLWDPLLGDRRCFEKVIDVLLDNAVKFTDAGCVSTRVRLEGASDEALEVSVTVADTGIGMSPEVLGHLFVPFYQGEGAIVRRFGGVGLGLALGKKLADRMGATMAVESQPGVGTVFVLKASFRRPAPT